jgi:CRP-like cAMP-binding protein
MALLGDHQRTASAIAATDCRLTPINERRFLFLVQETPFFALHIMKVLADRILRKESGSS